MALQSRLLTARFGHNPVDGSRQPLSQEAESFVGAYLGSEEIPSDGWPDMPFADQVFAAIDTVESTKAAPHRYNLRWLKAANLVLVVDRALGNRRTKFVVTGVIACAAARYAYDPGFAADSPEACQDVARLGQVILQMGVQAMQAHNTGAATMHQSELPEIWRPRFRQLPFIPVS